MSDFVTSFFGTLNSRLKNPLIFGFIFSWVVVNWKIVLIIFSSHTINTQKIELIQQAEYFNSINLFWLPLLTSSILVLILKPISAGIAYLHNFIDKWHYEKRRDANLALINLEKQEENYQDRAELLESHSDLAHTLNMQAKDLDAKVREVEKLQRSNQDLQESNTKNSNDLRTSRLELDRHQTIEAEVLNDLGKTIQLFDELVDQSEIGFQILNDTYDMLKKHMEKEQ